MTAPKKTFKQDGRFDRIVVILSVPAHKCAKSRIAGSPAVILELDRSVNDRRNRNCSVGGI